MPEHVPALKRRCPHCDGFPVVSVTTGQRTTTGHRATIPATCPACRGTGARALPSSAPLATARG